MVDKRIMREINNLYLSFDRTYDFYEKGYIWYVILILKKMYPQDQFIYNMYNDLFMKTNLYHNELSITNQICISDKQEYVKNSCRIFKEKIPKIDNKKESFGNNLCELEDNTKLMILENFIKKVSYNMYVFFKYMVDENRIILGNTNETITTNLNNSNTLVFIKDDKNIHDLLVLLHELGHAYYIYLNKQVFREREDLNNEIKMEIPSKLMEIKFINYLKEIMPQASLILEKEFYRKTKDYYNKRGDYDYLKYFLGSYVALYVDIDINIDYYFKYIYQNDIENIIQELEYNKILKKHM